MAMNRVFVDGKVINERTRNMLARAQLRTGLNFRILQGSYNRGGVSQSAGTHDGGGAVDISVAGMSDRTIRNVVLQLRKCGFAAWHRTPSQGPWVAHIHMIAIGDPEMSTGARAQVISYYAGKNGLANGGRDDGPRLDPIPRWYIKLPGISAGRAKAQFSRKIPRKGLVATEKIQRMLNYRLGTDLKVDGQAGKLTKAAYKRWEMRLGMERPDGIPQPYSLKPLMAGFYRVVK